MKKLLVIFLTITLSLTLTSCKRKNVAKNLEIYSKKGSTYIIRYCSSKLDFGDFYITITDEKLVNFYTISNENYKLDNYKFTIGDYTASCNVTSEKTKKETKTVFELSNPFSLISEVDKEGYETTNPSTIKMYVKFIDVRTDSDTEDELLDDSYITVSTVALDLVEFVRNKEIKTKSE